MKKAHLFLCVLLLVLLAACGPAEPVASEGEEAPLQLETLTVELSRLDLPAQELAQAVRELPEALKTALAAQAVETETVTVSVGSAPAATVQAVREGGVDLAFLPPGDLDALEEAPQPLLAASPESGDAPDSMAAIVHPDGGTLSGEAFAQALAAAVNSLRESQPVFGPYDYVRVAPGEETP